VGGYLANRIAYNVHLAPRYRRVRGDLAFDLQPGHTIGGPRGICLFERLPLVDDVTSYLRSS
jgi:hypothetical protein